MVRIRKTKRWGNSDVIILAPSDKRDLDINIGIDEIDIDDIRIIKNAKSNSRKPKSS